MLAIRLSRTGKKGQQSFNIILQEHARSPKRKYFEKLGHYHPALKEKTLEVDMERIKYWISKGATPTDAVAVLLKNKGLSGMEKFILPRNKKLVSKKAKGEASATPATTAPTTASAPEKTEEKPAEKPQAKEEAPAPTSN